MTCHKSRMLWDPTIDRESGLDFEDYMGVAVAFPQKLGAQIGPSLAGDGLATGKYPSLDTMSLPEFA